MHHRGAKGCLAVYVCVCAWCGRNSNVSPSCKYCFSNNMQIRLLCDVFFGPFLHVLWIPYSLPGFVWSTRIAHVSLLTRNKCTCENTHSGPLCTCLPNPLCTKTTWILISLCPPPFLQPCFTAIPSRVSCLKPSPRKHLLCRIQPVDYGQHLVRKPLPRCLALSHGSNALSYAPQHCTHLLACCGGQGGTPKWCTPQGSRGCTA